MNSGKNKNLIFFIIVLLFMVLNSCDDSEHETNCGDSFVDFDEECDGVNLNGQTCQTLGYNGGELKCTDICTFNINGCQTFGMCGDGIVNGNEECDGNNLQGKTCVSLNENYVSGELKCRSDCTFDKSSCIKPFCGNGTAEIGESCDGTDLNGFSCLTLGYHDGELACNTDCTYNLSSCETFGMCGDGTVQEIYEECDGLNLNETSCLTLGYHGGNLLCNADCTYNLSNCISVGMCGDNTVQTEYNESCDGTDLNGFSCLTLGYYGGELVCNADCTYNLSSCETFGVCGDGTVQTQYGEECEANNLNGAVCSDISPELYSDTILSCGSDCKYDISLCGYCGDGILQSAHELCDGTEFISDACLRLGFFQGIPESCDTSCLPSTDGCVDIIEWGTSGYDRVISMVVDATGNLYVTGSTDGAFPGYVNAGSDDAFVTKYNSDKTFAWTLQWGSDDTDKVYDISVDNAGNLYVTGTTYGSMQSDVTPLGQDIFVTKISPDGSILWTKQWGESSTDIGKAIKVFGNNVYLAGTTDGDMDGVSSYGFKDVFLIKFTTDGTKIWTRIIGNSDANEDAYGINIDTDEYIYISARTDGAFLGYTNQGGTDVFFLKYDYSGTLYWIKQYGSDADDMPSDIAISPANDVYFGGNTYSSMPDATSLGNIDVFVMKFNSNGAKVWTVQWGSAEYEDGVGLACDSSGNLYATGTTYGSVGGASFVGSGSNIFVTKFDFAGNRMWTKQWGAVSYTSGKDIEINKFDKIFCTGYAYGVFEQNVYAGATDAFLLEVHP